MPARGVCPNPECKERLDTVEAEEITVLAAGQQFGGVSFVCPKCRSVVSVEISPQYAKPFSKLLEEPRRA